jgi:Tfp pilus assembly protein PilV
MEVLATLVLVGVVLPVAMRGISMSLQASADARHRVEAAQLAQQKIAEHLVVRDASTFNTEGDFGPDWPEYRWQSRSAYADVGVYVVTVRVSWQRRAADRFIEVSTLVYPVTGLDLSEDAASDTTESEG